MIMKKKPLKMKSKMGVCILLFAFLLLPISTNIALAADEVITGDKEGTKVAQAGAGAGEAAAGVAATGASAGLSGAAIAAIAVGVAAAAVAVIAVASGDDDDVTTTAHH